ncbi:MAG: DNA N-6-adenine-methyltransferase [Acetobacteraceae bacterium]
MALHNRLRKFAPVTGEVARIAKKRSTKRAGKQVLQPVQLRNLSGRSGQVPPLDQLLREGRASSRRIAEQEKGIRRFRKTVLIEWLDQAERLWIAAEIHGLKNKHFIVFAAQIGVDRSSAYELLKLHPKRKEVLAQCKKHNHWPGWEICASWFKADGGSNLEPDAPTARNKGLLTPSWQRFKVSDDEYGTPQALFDHYDRIYHFTFDVCSTPQLAKCKKFYTLEQDGLQQEWIGVCWMNPPYSALRKWVKKAYEAAKNGAVVVALLPMFTDAAWFHDYASHATIEVLKGRLQFANRTDNGYTPFGHGIFVFRGKSARVDNQLAISLDGHRIGTSSSRNVAGRAERSENRA